MLKFLTINFIIFIFTSIGCIKAVGGKNYVSPSNGIGEDYLFTLNEASFDEACLRAQNILEKMLSITLVKRMVILL